MNLTSLKDFTWQEGSRLVGWSIIGLVAALGVYELALVLF